MCYSIAVCHKEEIKVQYSSRAHFASLRDVGGLHKCKSAFKRSDSTRRLVGILAAGGCKVEALTLDITAEMEGDYERSDVEQNAHERLRRTQRKQRPMACLHQR
jgi:hypothetical protein